MNISNVLSLSVSLGLVAALSSPSLCAMGGDSRVRMVEFPEDVQTYMWIVFSGDGSTAALTSFSGNDATIHVDRGDGWALVHRAVGGLSHGHLHSYGVSHDGSVVGVTDFSNASMFEGVATTTVPREWIGSDGRSVYGWLQGAVLSGDGRHVGMHGSVRGDYHTQAVIWNGDDMLVNLSRDLPQDGVSYRVNGLSNDGSVAVFGADYRGPLNNIRDIGVDRDVWVWEDGELGMVPQIAMDYEVAMRAQQISGNGEAVIGSAQGMWYEGFGEDGHLSEGELSHDLIFGPDHAWVWTRDGGTVAIADEDRFLSTTAIDITDDGRLVLGRAGGKDGHAGGYFLWSMADGFLMINDLFYKLGISIEADYYSFYQLSSDGSRLMGVSRVDAHYSAITVTIPVQRP